MSPVQPARIDYVPAFPAIQFTQRALLHPPREGRHEPKRAAGEGIADATVRPVRIGGAIRDKPSFPPRISANSAVKPQTPFAPNKLFRSLKPAIAGQSQAAQLLSAAALGSVAPRNDTDDHGRKVCNVASGGGPRKTLITRKLVVRFFVRTQSGYRPQSTRLWTWVPFIL